MSDPWKTLEDALNSCPPGYENSPEMLRDFQQLFSTPQGQRVFNMLMGWCGMFRSSYVRGDPNATYVREGERNIGARLWIAVTKEPKERPTQTVRRKPNG